MTLSAKNLPISFIILTLGVLGVCVYITTLPQFFQAPYYLSFGVTTDIAFGIPLLFYLLVVRKYKLSLITLAPVFILSSIVASFILPDTHHYYLNFVQQGLIFLELLLASVGILKIRAIIKTYHQTEFITPDFIEKLYRTFTSLFGVSKVNGIVVSEVATFYYLFFFWQKKREVYPHQQQFTYHKNSGYVAIWAVFVFLMLLETVIFHLIAMRWSEAFAWGLSALSIYGLVFFVADLTAIFKRPIVVDGGQLYLRIGLRWRVLIPIRVIEQVEEVKNWEGGEKDLLKASLMGQPDVVLHLREPVLVKGLYGITKQVTKIAIQLDEVEKFKKALYGSE